MDKEIQIALLCDNNLPFALATTMVSILENANKDTFVDFYILSSPDFSDDNINKINEIASSRKACKITFIIMDERFSHMKTTNPHVSMTAANRLVLAEMLPHLEKILYLDIDIIVRDDLCKIFFTELEENYIAGVFSYTHYLYLNELKAELQIPDLSQYVNSGVLLFNLAEIRKDNIEEKFCSLLGSYKNSVDQHIINKVCYGRIKHLNPMYNVTLTNMNLYYGAKINIFLSPKDSNEIISDPAIFHWSGPRKPWKFYDMPYAYEWLQYYKKTPYKNEILEMISINSSAKNKTYSKFIKLLSCLIPIRKYRKKFRNKLTKGVI